MVKHKVYVTLGFHINFYHSWRGDTPDEAGFGTDIRVIREILRILNQANQAGLKARGYWDTEVYWTFQEILPRYAPDILEDIRRRVAAGCDEIVPGPFNNGANHAATEDEFRASIAWAIENPWGSGLKQLFGRVAPFYRPQETMFTVGQEAILKEYGIEGVILYYAGVPFNTISTFIPPLKDGQRYNPLWFRSREDQPRLILLPCISAADLIEEVSLEALMLKLHQKQERGEINSDVLIHINEDADLDTWLPVKLPKQLKWFPNTGGLEEYIRAVNRYPWADFTLPSEYTASNPPQTEVLVRQDLADGGFDGNYSWAEKCSSLRAWTLLEQSRLASYRAEALAKRAGIDLSPTLWEGMDSSFFQRLIGLSTTHFGMSTPIINEERQNKAFAILGHARHIAMAAERIAAEKIRHPSSAALYEFELYITPSARHHPILPKGTPVNLPILLPAGVKALRLEDENGDPVPVSLTDLEGLPDGWRSARLRFIPNFHKSDHPRYRLSPADSSPSPFIDRLKNNWLEIIFSPESGIETFSFEGKQIGDRHFLKPFITYGRRTFRPKDYEFIPLTSESWAGIQRVRLRTHLPIRRYGREYPSIIEYTFTLFDDLPYLFLDVNVQYAATPKNQVIHNLTQKLRRLMDLNWVEVAPCQLIPLIQKPIKVGTTAGSRNGSFNRSCLRVWKRNFMGLTSYYDVNYGRINPKNCSLDSFNHQVTAGWVAVTNGETGLLVGEDAQRLASMAFCPMRLQEKNSIQTLSLNPFGSYYGKQFDYAHLGGNGCGKDFMIAFSGALKPNAPSFNGETLSFSLLLAPYHGDEPPDDLQRHAAAHFYPPGILFHSTPPSLDIIDQADIEHLIEQEKRRAALQVDAPLPPPSAFLVNPSPGAVDLVWDAPRDSAVTGYEIHWRSSRESAWNRVNIGDLTRWHIGELKDGQSYRFRMRAVQENRVSAWTTERTCKPGAVTGSSVISMLGRIPMWTMLRLIILSLRSVWNAAKYRSSRQNNG